MQEQAGFWLSPQQKLAWSVQEALERPARAICHVSLQGGVDFDRLRAALAEVIERHEALRTGFRRPTGMKVPLQVVHDEPDFQLEKLDLSSRADDQQRAAILDLLRAEEFRSAVDHAIRATLVELTPEKFALVMTVPSLCADASSLKVLVRELAAIYNNDRNTLGEPFRYLQFSQWQSDLLESDDEDARRGREFWSKQLSRSPASPPLPFEHRVGEAHFKPATVIVQLKSPVASQVLRSSEPHAILFAAWECLLVRISGHNALMLGYFAENREYDELRDSIGCFGRILPLNVHVESGFTFSDVLRHSGSAIRESIAVQEYFAPELIGLNNELVGFAFSDIDAGLNPYGLPFTLESAHAVSERYKLKLNAVRREDELRLEFEYDAARFTGSAIERIAGWYQNLLAAVADPATPVARLPLLSEEERRQVVVEWNQTRAAYPSDKSLHELFEQQAASTPGRVAVRSGGHSLTYSELNERANQLAHYLRRQGVGADERVGLCLERSVEMMVAVLGIMKAGGAYVPLNADNPPARLEQQLEGARAVLTETRLLSKLPELAGCSMIVLDRDEQLWSSEPKANPVVNTTPENLVYVIYTSGSTGVPKGVAVRHRNLVNYADFIAKKLRLSDYPDGLEFATVSTLGADLGNTCIYPALIAGGTLHVISHEVATDPQQFAAYTAKHPIDVLKIVPSHLSALLQSEEARAILPRRFLITGGEALTPQLLEKIEKLEAGCEVLNHYGPTETTVGSLTLELKHYNWKHAGLATIPIGRPIQNTEVYILDQNLEPVPVGVTGELYIAGAGVTAGYIGQAEKTAERFVRNPFSTDATARMYRTGDVARYLEDGNIEFLGRGDDQVKIRGFRIELGEIEAVLGQHPGVKQAVVMARTQNGDASGDKRLVGYVVLHADAVAGKPGTSPITPDSLKQHLQQYLPEYMVPQALVFLPKLPLNANGKLDRQALPEPEQAQAQKAYVAPRTPTEKTIAEVWAEVLRRPLDKISLHDNFFDLGGHSLLATQVVSRLRQRLMVEIPMRAIFDKPTLSRLAESVEKSETIAVDAEPITITRAPREAYRASK